jgi:hypothetical protein
MKIEDLTHEQYGLLFNIRRSIRYHDRRRAFFETLHRVTSALTILLSGGVLFEMAADGPMAEWMKWIGLMAALFSVFDMVIGYSASGNRHAELRARFIDLEKDILQWDGRLETWDSYRIARLEIERDEPPIYRALDLLCYREICLAEGTAPQKMPSVGFYQRITSHIFPWASINEA